MQQQSHILTHNGHDLAIQAVSLGGGRINNLVDLVKPIFNELKEFIKEPRQVIYVRDIKDYSIQGIYPGGHTYLPVETHIAVPSWAADEQHLIATFAHEMHHMVRWQNPGFGTTLGENIVSEGLATLYEEVKSGFTPPWAQTQMTDTAWSAIKESWNDENYAHHEWFYKGPLGEWIGYSAGYHLAKKYFDDGFNLKDSILVAADELV